MASSAGGGSGGQLCAALITWCDNGGAGAAAGWANEPPLSTLQHIQTTLNAYSFGDCSGAQQPPHTVGVHLFSGRAIPVWRWAALAGVVKYTDLQLVLFSPDVIVYVLWFQGHLSCQDYRAQPKVNLN